LCDHGASKRKELQRDGPLKVAKTVRRRAGDSEGLQA
jgi:hypothetical protein